MEQGLYENMSGQNDGKQSFQIWDRLETVLAERLCGEVFNSFLKTEEAEMEVGSRFLCEKYGE